VVMMLASYVLREPQPKKPGPAPAKQAPGG